MRIESPHHESLDQRLNRYESLLATAIDRAKELVKKREAGQEIPDFDIRGELYMLALELASDARLGDIEQMHHWINPKAGEVSVDIAAGTGLLTKAVADWTHANVYAVDPSVEQLKYLTKSCSDLAIPVLGSPDDPQILEAIPRKEIDSVTSFGGLHHVPDQRLMMVNATQMLKSGGRFVAADVCRDTALSKHFDEVVADKCITGHTATWLDESRLNELISGLPLQISKTETVPLTWVFENERQMALFFKGLHAYDLPNQEIIDDLKSALGTELIDGKVHLNWPMLFFQLRKI